MTLFQQKKKSIQIIALFPNITLKKLHSLTILRLMHNQRFQKLFLFIFNYFQNFSSSITQFVIRPAIRSFIGKIGNVSQERFDSCASSKFPRIRLYSLREHGFERFGVIEHLPRLEIHFATTWGPCDRKRACTCGKTRRSEPQSVPEEQWDIPEIRSTVLRFVETMRFLLQLHSEFRHETLIFDN